MKNCLAEIRKKQNLSQEKLAKIVGISRPALSNIENGVNPNGDTMLKIAQALGKPAHEIFLINK